MNQLPSTLNPNNGGSPLKDKRRSEETTTHLKPWVDLHIGSSRDDEDLYGYANQRKVKETADASGSVNLPINDQSP